MTFLILIWCPIPNVHLAKDLLGEFWTIKVVVTKMADVIMTSKWPILSHSWPYTVLVWCFLVSNHQGNLNMTTQRVNILIFTLKFTKNGQDNPKWPRNSLPWPILLNFWTGNVQARFFLCQMAKLPEKPYFDPGRSTIRFSPFTGSTIWQNESKYRSFVVF